MQASGPGDLDDVADGDGADVVGPGLAVIVRALVVADLEGGIGGFLAAADAVAGLEDQAQGAVVVAGGGGERVVGLVASKLSSWVFM
ncbi:hypothetical protein [Streptomyces flaveolus]|uniref:hypothetical protein n=1 Tax=Streptomyces flaveolus TaxID=67297 RepID=UPI00331F0C37